MTAVKRKYDASSRRTQASARRHAVVLAARALFERDGFRPTTIAAVAQRAGVSEESVYKGRLIKKHGLHPVVPDQAGRDMVHRAIYEELCQGIVTTESKAAYLDEITRMRRDEKIDGVILGCTEITMLIGQPDFDIPVFDTTRIHAGAAVEFALG